MLGGLPMGVAKVVLGIVLCSSGASQALGGPMEPDWLSPVYAGRGFSTAATSTSSEAVFANPAGLSRMRNPRSRDGLHEVNFPRITLTGSERSLGKLGDALGDPQGTTSNPLPEALRAAEPNGNSELRFETRVFPSLVFGGKSAATWLVGAFSDSRTTLVRQTGSEAGRHEVTRDTTIGGVLGVSASSRSGTVSYGLSVRPNARYYSRVADVMMLPETSPADPTSLAGLQRTLGVGIDAGLLFTAADFWLPTLGLVVRNLPLGCVAAIEHPYAKSSSTICGARRSGAIQSGEIRTQVDPTEVRLGVSMTPRFRLGPERLNLRLSAEASPLVVPLGDASYGLPDVPLESLLKAGAELYFGHPLIQNSFAIRSGVSDGEATWGVSIGLSFVSIDYASFARRKVFDDRSNTTTRQHSLGLSAKW